MRSKISPQQVVPFDQEKTLPSGNLWRGYKR